MFRWLNRVILSLLLLCLVVTGCEREVSEMEKREVLETEKNLAQWKDARARRLPWGTVVHWTIDVRYNLGDNIYGTLAGTEDCRVGCSIYGDLDRDSEAFHKLCDAFYDVSSGDRVEVWGKFLVVDKDGNVVIGMNKFKNLGPVEKEK